jgi:hypothetical protein
MWIPQPFSNIVIFYLLAYEDGTDSVPKRRHIKFRRRGITQKKTYNIQNTAKVWNQIIILRRALTDFLKIVL